jgi:hypothetical protein
LVDVDFSIRLAREELDGLIELAATTQAGIERGISGRSEE